MKRNIQPRRFLSTVLRTGLMPPGCLVKRRRRGSVEDVIVKEKGTRTRRSGETSAHLYFTARMRNQSLNGRAFRVQEPWYTCPFIRGKKSIKYSHRALCLLPQIPSLISDGEISSENKNGIKHSLSLGELLMNASWGFFNCKGRGKEMSP